MTLAAAVGRCMFHLLKCCPCCCAAYWAGWLQVFDFFNGGELYHYLSEGGRFTEARAK